jgi:nitrite reductase/ring-hydroxylating ferredoxin subunit/uncharacterized membrane protein
MEYIEPNSKVGQIVDDAIEKASGLDEAGKVVRQAVVSVTARSPLTRRIADFLHGTWLGHPLHIVLTDFTVGTWVAGAILDVAGTVSGSESLEDAADIMIGLGTTSALGTAVTGLNDYSRIKQDAARAGLVHGLLNSAAFMSYAFSLVARKSGNRNLGMALSMTGLSIATASAWIGGDMVYRLKAGINHAVPPQGLENWTPIMADSDLREGEPRRVEVDGNPILLYRRWGIVLAMGAVCSHAGGPLEEGKFEWPCVECPWHQSVFDLRDGSVVHGPATMQEPSYETRVQNGQIEVRVHPPTD